MEPIDFFKLQAKNPFKDFKTQTTQFDAESGAQADIEVVGPAKKKREIQIKSLPFNDKDRKKFIKTANEVFETVMWRMEPNNPELTREL